MPAPSKERVASVYRRAHAHCVSGPDRGQPIWQSEAPTWKSLVSRVRQWGVTLRKLLEKVINDPA